MTDAEVERVERLLDRLADRRGPVPTDAEWNLVDRAMGELAHRRALIDRLRAKGCVIDSRCIYCMSSFVDGRIDHAKGCEWVEIEQA